MTSVKYPEPLVFGLDIGTRSIVGTVGYKEKNKFNVVAMAVKFHETRSMIDGQIHDIGRVAEDIRTVRAELEEQLGGRKLKEVCIAAAGRVLKTAVGHADYEFPESTLINQEYIHSLDLIGVEQAHAKIMEELSKKKEDATKYYCVGYTAIKYFLNDYEISNLEAHKGTKIAADILATFLPEEVVTSLYEAVEEAGLYVTNLTLEPIAAINVAIPEQYRLLNIALVDVGAGTSDICITKDGSIIGYGMIPSAGDELTEILIKKYLIDFDTAEMLKTVGPTKKTITYKDIMGIPQKITPAQIAKDLEGVKQDITNRIAEKIKELNGGEPVSAIFVVGGGGKFEGFTESLAKATKLPNERVALRGEEVMQNINFAVENVKKDSLYVTPIGICLSFFDHKNNFIFVTVNGERIKLYNNDKLTIFDAAVQYGLPNEDLFPKRGEDITFKVNGKTRIVRGLPGETAVIKLNGTQVGMNSVISADDKIEITTSTVGQPASAELSSLPEFGNTIDFKINGEVMTCPRFALVNGEIRLSTYQIAEGDDVEMQSFYTVEQLLAFLDIPKSTLVYVNNSKAKLTTKIYENFEVTYELSEEEAQLSFSDLAEGEETEDAEETTETETSEAEPKKEQPAKKPKTEPAKQKVEIPVGAITRQVTVNGKPVVMTGKDKYIFVNIFDYIDFDLTTVRGKHLVTNIDGRQADFNEELSENAVIDVYWER